MAPTPYRIVIDLAGHTSPTEVLDIMEQLRAFQFFIDPRFEADTAPKLQEAVNDAHKAHRLYII